VNKYYCFNSQLELLFFFFQFISPLCAELWKEERTKEWHSEQQLSKHNW